jgi:CHAT domain-containing protein
MGEGGRGGEVQALADRDTLLLVYLLAEPHSFAWTVDRERIVPHILPGRKTIETLARRLAVALPQSHEQSARGAAERAANGLAEAILAPLAERLAGHRRLVILPDGALNLVAFAALPVGDRGVKVLLDAHEIVLIPSATVLLRQRQRLSGRPPAPKELAVLADPIFSITDPRLRRGGPDAAALSIDRGDPALAFGPLARLPYTADEAWAIARLVPEDQRLVLLGAAASRDLAMSGALRGYRILHFATHGLLHPVLPERSGLVLSRVDSQGHPRNGFLSAPDVAALDLPADLVVLSACRSGLGRELRGEGLVGLTQAFFRAGARGVIVSSWDVRDRATADLMTRFYTHLLVDHLPPAAALRAAQLALRENPATAAPSFWAGFTLHGDWQ